LRPGTFSFVAGAELRASAACNATGPVHVLLPVTTTYDAAAQRFTVAVTYPREPCRVAPDGTIEAVRVEHAPGFAYGVQWHPEWRYLDNPASLALFRAFGEACRTYQGGVREAA